MRHIMMLFIFCTAGILQAQQQSSDVMDKLLMFDSLAAVHHNKDTKLAVEYSRKALDQAIILKDSAILGDAYYNVASALFNVGSFQESLNYWDHAFSYVTTTRDSARILNEKGAVFIESGDPDQALGCFLSALKKCDDTDSTFKSRIYNELGFLYRSIDEYDTALWYFKEMSKIKTAMKGTKVHRSYMNIGLIHLDLKEYDSAIKYFNLSYEGMQGQNEIYGLSIYHNNMGSAYSDMQEFEKALPYAEKAIYYKKMLGNKNRLANSYNLMSFIQLGLRQYQEAEKYAELSLSLIDTLSMSKVRYNALRYLVESRIGQQDTSQVMDLVYQIIELKDNVHDQQKTAAFSEMSAKFDLEKKEAEILNKNLALELAEGELDRQGILRNSLLAVLALAIVIVGLVYRNHRLKSASNRELKKKNKEIESLNEAKSRWFVNVSHELRTPLTLVKGPLMNASVSDKLNPKVKEHLKMAVRNLGNLENLVNEILDLSKMESGKMGLISNNVDLTKLVRESASAFDSLADELKIKLTYHLDEHICMFVDYAKLYKVITNLMSNAIKFTHDGGEVVITLKSEADKVLLMVADTGEGIPDSDLPHIFDRFYQSQSQKKSRQGGTGIGLALSREIAQLHGGELSVTSKIMEGSVFTLILPGSLIVETADKDLAEQFTEPTEIEEIIAFTGFNDGKPKMLLVDDNKDMRSFITGFMEQDYFITEARDGLDALEQMKSMTPDIILSDIMMPRMGGILFIKELKKNEEWRKIPLIALTALAKESDKLYTLQIGIDDYLVKPFNPKELKVRAFNLIKHSIERRNSSYDEKVSLSHEDELLMKLQREVEDHLTESTFNIARLASVVAMSERQLYRTVKRISGLTPSQFVREIRLKKAMLYIEQNRFATISELSHAVGFEYPGYFTSVFEKRFGNKPADYM